MLACSTVNMRFVSIWKPFAPELRRHINFASVGLLNRSIAYKVGSCLVIQIALSAPDWKGAPGWGFRAVVGGSPAKNKLFCSR